MILPFFSWSLHYGKKLLCLPSHLNGIMNRLHFFTFGHTFLNVKNGERKVWEEFSGNCHRNCQNEWKPVISTISFDTGKAKKKNQQNCMRILLVFYCYPFRGLGTESRFSITVTKAPAVCHRTQSPDRRSHTGTSSYSVGRRGCSCTDVDQPVDGRINRFTRPDRFIQCIQLIVQ